MSGQVLYRVLEGGPSGCLLLHGFSGSPLEMVPLAEALATEGWTVAIGELAGHASPRDLARATWRDWLRSGEVAYRYLRRRCTRTAVVGLSMGGAVGLCLAPLLRPAAVVAISTPVRVKRVIARASRVASRVLPYVPVLIKIGPPEREMRRYRSPSRRIPLKATQQVDLLLEAMCEALPRVRTPTLVVQGRRDWVIPRDSAREIVARASATEAELLWLPRSGHVATLDRDRQMLYTEVRRFLHAHLDRRRHGEGAAHGAAD